MVEAIIDISLRKVAQKDLLESEHKYRKLFEEANDAIFLSDVTTGHIIDANKKAERLLGQSVREIIGMHHSQLYDSKTSRNSTKTRLKENLNDFETTVTRKSGEIVPVHVSSSELTLSGKQLVQEIFRDITDLKQSEKQLIDYQKELRSLASQLSLAEERERRRLAIYVHDHISQVLATCSMKLSALFEEVSSTRTKEAIDEVAQAILTVAANQTYLCPVIVDTVVKNYYGVFNLGYNARGAHRKFVWIDQDLMESMGY